jgi:hypothetical protein
MRKQKLNEKMLSGREKTHRKKENGRLGQRKTWRPEEETTVLHSSFPFAINPLGPSHVKIDHCAAKKRKDPSSPLPRCFCRKASMARTMIS